jgi:glycosyltransferase involved in cell wall biosynthesis
MRKANILQIIDTLKLAGAERIVTDLAINLDKDKYNVIICCLRKEGGPLVKELRKKGIKVIILDKKLGMDFSIIRKIRKIIKEEKIDLVHTHLFTANLWGRLAAILMNKTIIVTEHNTDYWKNWLHKFIDKFLEKFTNKIITVSDGVSSFYQEYENIPRNKIKTIYNGIDLRKFSNSKHFSKKARIIGMIARLNEQKNYRNFLNAAYIINKQDTNINFLIVGEGPLKEDLEKYAQRLGKNIKFLGQRKDIPEIIKGIDIFVLSSDYEGLPLTILEAMAASKSVVATNVGGIPEAVEDGKTGILVPPKNPDALANAIMKLLKNPRLRKQMGEAGRKRAEKYFTMEKMVKKYEDVYDWTIK